MRPAGLALMVVVLGIGACSTTPPYPDAHLVLEPTFACTTDCLPDTVYQGEMRVENHTGHTLMGNQVFLGAGSGLLVRLPAEDMFHSPSVTAFSGFAHNTFFVQPFEYRCTGTGGRLQYLLASEQHQGGEESNTQIACPVPLTPAISITGAGGPIANGGTETITGAAEDVAVSRSYTIVNSGMADLTMIAVTVTTQSNCDVMVNGSVPTTVAPNATSGNTFSVSLIPQAAGAFSCTLAVASNDVMNPYTITLAGTAAAAPAPDLVVTDNNIPLIDGDPDAIDATRAGETTMAVYGITNNGNGPLTITGVTFGTTTNCTAVATQPLLMIIPPGGSTTFTVSITPTNAGTWIAPLLIANDDENYQPAFDILIGGVADAALVPGLQVTDNTVPMIDGDPDTIGTTMAGATTMAVYGINNTGTGALTISSVTFGTTTNCMAIATLPGLVTIPPGGSTTFMVSITPTNPGTWIAPLLIASNDQNYQPAFDVIIGGNAGAALVPGMQVTDAGSPLIDGEPDGVGTTTAGMTVMAVYGITNTGTGPLTIGVVSFGTTTNCTATAMQPGLTTIPAGGSTTFTVSITPASPGTWIAPLLIPNNDVNYQPAFDISITGNAGAALVPDLVVTDAGTPLIDGDTDGVGSTTAGVTVMAVYGITNNGTGPLTISGVTLGTTTNCSATATPPGLMVIPAGGSTTFTVTITPTNPGTWIAPVLIANDDTNYQPAFDIIVTGNADAPIAPDINVVGVANGMFDGGTPFNNSPFSLTFTIENLGNALLTLSGITFPSTTNCMITLTVPCAPSVAPGNTTTFTVSVRALAAGAFSCRVSIANNDPDVAESPFVFDITGVAN